MSKRPINTLEDAVQFVLDNKVVTVFGSKKSDWPSLYDNVNRTDKKPEGGGWNPRVTAVWTWKTRIPQTYPDKIFYGKIPGGDAVLMDLEYLRTVHYPEHHKPVSELDDLSRQIYGYIRQDPWFTGDLRNHAMMEHDCTKSRFDTALKKLQISLNIVRSNNPEVENDLWLPFEELYPDIVAMHGRTE
ncbi:MAG: hypothetical protein R2832_13880 [Rhodothermales bacterium]